MWSFSESQFQDQATQDEQEKLQPEILKAELPKFVPRALNHPG
jgi:hypothetical protein